MAESSIPTIITLVNRQTGDIEVTVRRVVIGGHPSNINITVRVETVIEGRTVDPVQEVVADRAEVRRLDHEPATPVQSRPGTKDASVQCSFVPGSGTLTASSSMEDISGDHDNAVRPYVTVTFRFISHIINQRRGYQSHSVIKP